MCSNTLPMDEPTEYPSRRLTFCARTFNPNSRIALTYQGNYALIAIDRISRGNWGQGRSSLGGVSGRRPPRLRVPLLRRYKEDVICISPLCVPGQVNSLPAAHPQPAVL